MPYLVYGQSKKGTKRYIGLRGKKGRTIIPATTKKEALLEQKKLRMRLLSAKKKGKYLGWSARLKKL